MNRTQDIRTSATTLVDSMDDGDGPEVLPELPRLLIATPDTRVCIRRGGVEIGGPLGARRTIPAAWFCSPPAAVAQPPVEVLP